MQMNDIVLVVLVFTSFLGGVLVTYWWLNDRLDAIEARTKRIAGEMERRLLQSFEHYAGEAEVWIDTSAENLKTYERNWDAWFESCKKLDRELLESLRRSMSELADLRDDNEHVMAMQKEIVKLKKINERLHKKGGRDEL